MDAAPAMGVNPSAADIARYDAWAIRNGQPPHGGNQPAEPPAMPPAEPPAAQRRGRGWRRGVPRGAPQPQPHGVPAGEPQHPDDGWIRGTFPEGNKVWAQKLGGRRYVVQIWNSITKEYRVTPQGEDYFRHNRQEFIFRVPVIGYKYVRGVIQEAFRTWIPLTEEYIENHCPNLEHHNLAGLFGAGRVRDRLSGPAEVQAAITEAVHQYVANIGETDAQGRSILIQASEIWYCFDDSRPILYSEQIVRHIHDNGTPVIEYILDRPLAGRPVLPPNMYSKLGLCKIAQHDLKDSGGCMVAQIFECAKKRGLVGRTGSGNMGTRTGGHMEQKPVFKDPKEIEEAFDNIFAVLYPGEAGDVDGVTEPTRAYPYQFEGWRDVGVTTKMCEKLCVMKGMALRVVHDRRLIHSFDPVNKEKTRANNTPVLCYNIWGDHAFFYEHREAKNGVANLPKKVPELTKKPQSMTLKVEDKHQDDRQLFSEMDHYDNNVDVLKEAIASNANKTFYVYATEIDAIRENLEKNTELPGFYTRLALDPNKISCITFTQKKQKSKSKRAKVSVKIRVVPDDAARLQHFCSEFELKHQLCLPYRGESTAVLMHKAVQELMVYRRKYRTPALREAVSKRCGRKCAICGDPYGTKFDVDHIVPLRENGRDEESNLQALCRPCHAKKCEQEEANNTTRNGQICSELSPEMLNIFHYAPKPKQIYWGGPKPRDPKVNCIDAIACRENAIVDTDFALPVFCPLDEPRLCHDEHGALTHEPLYWDFVYVDVPDGDEKHRFPYTGRRFYWKGAVRYMLATGKIETRHLKAGLRATKHISPSELNDAFKAIKEIWSPVVDEDYHRSFRDPEQVPEAERIAAIRSAQKSAILSCIGLWNSIEQHVWKSVKSTNENDAGGPVKLRRELDDGVFEFAWSVDLIGLRSMRPIGQIALDEEQVCVAQILDIMKPFEVNKQIKRLGAVVDCVYYESKTLVSLAEALDDVRLPSGRPKFKIKKEDAFRSPVDMSVEPEIRNHEIDLAPPVWTEVYDPGIDELVTLIKERGGALITGAAGTGKTWTARQCLSQLRKALKAEGIEVKTFPCAVRHAAARLIGGSTIAHLLNKYRQSGGPKNALNMIIMPDEASEISVATWTQLAEWYLLGVRFVIIGDFDGQFLPMFDRWGDALETNDIQTSQFFHSLCEGTRVHFTQYRRGDVSAKPLFDFYCGLYPRLKLPSQTTALDMSLEEARAKFPHNHDMPDVFLCLSHKKRMDLNHATNLYQAALRSEEPLLIPCTKSKTLGVTMEPQDMRIWPGMELLGCIHRSNSKTVVNGVLYVVQRWDDQFVYLNVHPRSAKQRGDDEDDDEEPEKEADEADDDDEGDDEEVVDPGEGEIPADLKLSYEDVSKWLRLTHARCYGSIQGCTMDKQHIMLLDTEAPSEGRVRHFTLRHLIVGVSRAIHQDYVHIPTKEYEAALMKHARENYPRHGPSHNEDVLDRPFVLEDAPPEAVVDYDDDALDGLFMEPDGDYDADTSLVDDNDGDTAPELDGDGDTVM